MGRTEFNTNTKPYSYATKAHIAKIVRHIGKGVGHMNYSARTEWKHRVQLPE